MKLMMHAWIISFLFFSKTFFKESKKIIYFQTDIFIHMQIEEDDIPTIESKNFTIKQESEMIKQTQFSASFFSIWNQEETDLRFVIFLNPSWRWGMCSWINQNMGCK